MSCPRFITFIPFITYNSFNQYMHISLISLPFKPSKRRLCFFLRKKKKQRSDLGRVLSSAPACDTWPRATWRNQWCLYWRLEPDRSSSHHRTLPVDYSLSNAPWRRVFQGGWSAEKFVDFEVKRTTTHFGIQLFYAGFGVSDSLVILREETHETYSQTPKAVLKRFKTVSFCPIFLNFLPQVTPLKLHLPKERRAYVCGYDLGQPRPWPTFQRPSQPSLPIWNLICFAKARSNSSFPYTPHRTSFGITPALTKRRIASWPAIFWRKNTSILKDPYLWEFMRFHMDVSENGGTPKWMIYNGKPY